MNKFTFVDIFSVQTENGPISYEVHVRNCDNKFVVLVDGLNTIIADNKEDAEQQIQSAFRHGATNE